MKKPRAGRGLSGFLVGGWVWISGHHRDLFRLQAFLALRHFEFDLLSFSQRAVAVALDLAEMHEDVFLALALDETETLRAIEPLHRPCFASSHLFNLSFCISSLAAAPMSDEETLRLPRAG